MSGDTPEGVAGHSASRTGDAPAGAGGPSGPYPGEDSDWRFGAGISRPAVVPYERQPGDPLYRPLRIYTVDPSIPRLEGAVASVNVAFEPLEPGPIGALFEVDTTDGETGEAYRAADLDSRNVLIADGHDPSPSDPRFHQQMVYAVCSSVYSAFRTALGRSPAWGFGSAERPARLVLRPHAFKGSNAYYRNLGSSGELRFGYFEASDRPARRTMPGGIVFTSLSHDIVVHEVTHALLDGMRAKFVEPSSADVLAFHEAFADLVAIFHHFSYPDVVEQAIRRCRGVLGQSELLAQLAVQFGHTTGQGGPLRTAIESDPSRPRQYAPGLDLYELGSVLVSALFEAFANVYQRRTEALIRLATGGTGVMPQGELPHDLQAMLAKRAGKLASQFLAMCIRAIDYCPPVGMTFGDYLQALITADYDLVPDDPWDYRGALIDAFWRRNIYPRGAQHLSEDALLWRAPRVELPPVPELHFAELRFAGDPACPADVNEVRRQAACLGRFVTRPAHLKEFGLAARDDPRLGTDRVDLPVIESIRSARRAGPNGQVVFDLVAEITQACHVAASEKGPGFSFHGGSTVILSPQGRIRYTILKSVFGHGREERRRKFLVSDKARRYWKLKGDTMVPHDDPFHLMHG